MKNLGFTLLELLVTISIIGILSSVFVLSQPNVKNELNLQRAAFQLVKDLRKAEELALATNFQDCQSGIFQGYGIYFDTLNPYSYQLFLKCDSNKIEIRKINLPQGTKISSLSQNSLEILFKPPDPSVCINSSCWQKSEGEIAIFLEKNPSKIKRIKVNTAGKISIE